MEISTQLYRVGDAFDLYFDGFWLIANNVVSPDEEKINKQLAIVYQPSSEAVDKRM